MTGIAARWHGGAGRSVVIDAAILHDRRLMPRVENIIGLIFFGVVSLVQMRQVSGPRKLNGENRKR